jgi:hypothetical protein
MAEADEPATPLPVVEDDDEERGHRAPALPVHLWRLLRGWLARGSRDSRHWTPRVGDRVALHGRGTWLVYAVSLRAGTVELGVPGTRRLEDVEPADLRDLEALYGTPVDQHGRPVSRPRLTTAVVEAAAPDPSPVSLRAVPDADEPTGGEADAEASPSAG